MAKKDCSELSKLLTKIAMNIGSRPEVKNIDDITDQMKQHFPDMTRAGVVDAIVEVSEGQAEQVDALTKKLREIRQEARTDKALRARIDQLEKDIQDEIVPPKVTRPPSKASDVVKDLRSLRDDLKKTLSKSDEVQKAKVQAQIAELDKAIERGVFMPKVKEPAPKLSKELDRLVFERDRKRSQIRREIQNQKPKTAWDKVADVSGFIRAMKTSFDLSGFLRQGGFVVAAHPIRGIKAVPNMLRAFRSEGAAHRINNEIFNRANAPLYAKSKLFLAPIDGTYSINKREEAYSSDLFEKFAKFIPGLQGSERAYITILNQLRADSFDAMEAALAINGEVTQQEADAIANYINVATGRGGLGKMEQAAAGLNTIFFAARYTASRFQLLGGQPLLGAKARQAPRVQKQVAWEYARYALGLSTVYALASMAGGDLEDDPRSSDFGKIRFGNTRLDPLSGVSQTAVLLARLATGKTKSTQTGVTRKLRDAKFGQQDVQGTIGNFLRGKLAPVPGMFVDALAGENVVGEKVSTDDKGEFDKKVLGKYLLTNGITPLAFADMWDVMKEKGVPKGLAFQSLAILGMGLQTYGKHLDTMSKPELRQLLIENTIKKTTTVKGVRRFAGTPRKGREDMVKAIRKALDKNQGKPVKSKSSSPTQTDVTESTAHFLENL